MLVLSLGLLERIPQYIYIYVYIYILGLYRENGKENRNYYITIGYIVGYIGTIERKMETILPSTIPFAKVRKSWRHR